MKKRNMGLTLVLVIRFLKNPQDDIFKTSLVILKNSLHIDIMCTFH